MEFLKNLLSDKTLKTLTEKLGDDVVKSINEKLGDFKIDVAEEKFIPKAKFDEVNTQLKDVKNQVTERDKQISDLGNKAKGNEELTKQIDELKSLNEKTKLESEQKLLAREKEFAIIDALRDTKVKAKDADVVYKLLDHEKIEFKENKLNGIEDQIKVLKESKSYLFDIDNSKDKGGLPPASNTKVSSKEDKFAHCRKPH